MGRRPVGLFIVVLLISYTGTCRASAAGTPGRVVDTTPVVDASEREPVAVPEPSALAVRYHQTGIGVWAFARFWDVAVPAAVLLSGLSARLRDVARRVGRVWIVSVGVYVVLYLAIVFLADLPFRYVAGFVRQHAYGMSNQTLGKWLGDSLKSFAVDALAGAVFVWVPFWLIARYPRRWWLIVSCLGAPYIAFVMLIYPVWISPLYNHFGPMKDKALEQKILALAARAGVSGGRVFEVDKSVDTNAVNAYVTGLLGSHRIVLWDTLLKTLDEREVLAVMGHEMGHYVLNHVAWSITLSTVILLAGLFWVDWAGRRVIARYGGRLGVESLADVAATPLIVVLLAVSSTVLGPVAFAYSRHNEHEADRFSLELTRMNRSAGRAFVDLQRSNLGVPWHTPVEEIWRATHPSTAERITFANRYHPWVEGQPLRYGHLFRP